MKILSKGSIVRSTQGRDKNRCYLLTDIQSDRAYLVDGKYKTVDKPKKKNLIHIQIVEDVKEEFWDRLKRESNKNQQNIMVRSQLKKLMKEE